MSKYINWRRLIILIIDAVFINAAYFLAYAFSYYNRISEPFLEPYLQKSFLVTIIYLSCFIIFKLYRSLWSYAGLDEFVICVEACVAGGSINLIYSIFDRQIPLSISLLAAIFTMILVAGFRMSFRIARRFKYRIYRRKVTDCERVMVIGAGAAGDIIIREMKNSSETNMQPVCVIDDDRQKIGTRISSIPIVGNRFDIERIAKQKYIDSIVIAIPSLGVESKSELLELCKGTGCRIKTMPGIYEIINGDFSVKKIRDVGVEELLGKIPVTVDEEGIRGCIEGKTVLITGGAGTVGSELCRQIAKYKPKVLLIFDIFENVAYDLQSDLKNEYSQLDIKALIGSVRDKKRLEDIFQEYKPEIVFHAAAHKHINLMEDSPAEAIKNNVFGTLNMAEVADQYGAERFILISTDRAVSPTDIVGASKRICEMIVQSLDKKSKTKFASVRFGNLLRSSRSIIPVFKRQIEKGGPVTVSHRDMTRYFMSIYEASRLIIQAGALTKGGEIFVLDMGDPVRIYDLARDLIKFSGFEPDKDIEIRITGLRLGEKLHEEVLTDEEGVNSTAHEKIFVGRSVFDDFTTLKEKLENLKFVLEKGSERVVVDYILQTVKDLVPGFYNPVFEETAAANLALYDSEELINGKGDGKRIFLASPHMCGMEKEYIEDAFDTNWIAPLGPHVDGFEKEIANLVHINAAAAMTTGTAAIHMALRCLNVRKDDIVFCSTLTFSASCNPIIYERAIPVFIDSERESWNMSPTALQKAFEEYDKKDMLPKAVIVVNLYGQSADYDRIKPICDKYNVPIIEDAAESLGATYGDKFTGTIGKYGVFSFNGNKIITTSGGGMLVSDDELSIKKVRFAITQARDQARHYQHSELGFNYRMSNVLAGIGRGQLKVLNQRIKEKKNIYEFYKKSFSDIEDIEMMPIAPYGNPNYWLSVITIMETSKVKPIDVMVALEKENVESRPIWKPMHLQPFFVVYDFYSHNDEGISVAEDLFNRGVCLPSDTKMSVGEMERVVGIIKKMWE